MEKCRFCEAELEENSTVCPECGKDNAEMKEEVPVAEEPKAEAPAQKGILMTPGKIALMAAVFVALVAVIVGLLVAGRKPAENAAPETETVVGAAQTEESVPEETAEPTVPADGNPDDVTCKGTYTAADADVVAAADTVVAKAGDRELTNEQLQVFYWMEVRQFLANYGAYAEYLGLDISSPLDTQMCMVEEGKTWQQYFLDNALVTWQNYTAMNGEAEKSGYEVSDEVKQLLEETPADLVESAEKNGLSGVEEMLTTTMGAGATQDGYLNYLTQYYTGFGYYEQQMAGFLPTDKEIETYYDGHEGTFADDGVTKDACTVNVRHILITPEATQEGEETVITDEAWNSAETKAQAILDQWNAGKKTEESFAELANKESSDPGSNTNGGLYEAVREGQMVPEFNDWCFDGSRKVGDTGIVKTTYGYHIMYFSGSQTIWQESARQAMETEFSQNLVTEILSGYPLSAEFGKIVLGNVNITG